MRKLIILICILITGGAVYALIIPSLFPDTPRFPRTPTAEGTIGYVLEKIIGKTVSDAVDGTVANTLKLDNRSGTGYLKRATCTTI